jgi:hypothetical protein
VSDKDESDDQREQQMIQAFMRSENGFYQKMIQDELSWQQQQLQKEFEKIKMPQKPKLEVQKKAL